VSNLLVVELKGDSEERMSLVIYPLVSTISEHRHSLLDPHYSDPSLTCAHVNIGSLGEQLPYHLLRKSVCIDLSRSCLIQRLQSTTPLCRREHTTR
jgi:hypothetical protein